MPREFGRRDRVAEEIKRELGILITTQVKDPRVRLVVITDVEVSRDLAYATVHVGSFDVTAANDSAAQVLEGLRAASGFLKRELSRRLRLRLTPTLRFVEDATEREAQRLSQIIDSAVDEDRRHAVEDTAETSDSPSSTDPLSASDPAEAGDKSPG